MNRFPRIDWALGAFLFAAGFLVCKIVANWGINPADQSTVFDGGWRILSGQIPFRDFTMLTGLAPSAIQAVFFGVFGVNWPAYSLHSAIANGIFCVLVYFYLQLWGLPRTLAFLYALPGTVCFYAQIGTPYMEQEGFLFLLWCWISISKLARAEDRLGEWIWALSAVWSYVVVFFCKQNLAMFGMVPTAILIFSGPRWRQGITRIAIAAAPVSLILLAIAKLLGMRWDLFLESYLLVPAMIGAGRGNALSWLFEGWRRSFAFFHTIGFPVITLVALLLHPVARKSKGNVAFPGVIFAAAIEVACLTFAGSTMNQVLLGLPFVFFCLGLLHRMVLEMAGQRSLPGTILLLVALVEAGKVGYGCAMRTANDIDYSQSESEPLLTQAMQPLRYQVGDKLTAIKADQFDQLAAKLRSLPGNYFLFGDFALLYGISGKASVAPFGWIHSGMQSETFHKTYLPQYERRLQESLHRYGVKTIVVEGQETSLGVKLSDLPMIDRAIREHTILEESIGPTRIYHLDRPF